MFHSNNIIIITGPTGSGKTVITTLIYKFIPDIEVISADSMQIYRGMNIGTAKPNPDVLRKIPHHCIDIADPFENYDVMQFVKKAYSAIEDIRSRGKIPIIVGGTCLYINSIIQPLFNGPPRNDHLREHLRQQCKTYGSQYLYQLLKEKDPDYSLKINQNDIKRVIRALEVYYLTGKPISIHHKEDFLDKKKNENRTLHFITVCFKMNRGKLYSNINKRVDKMIEKGLFDETKNLLNRFYQKSNQLIQYDQLSSFRSLGYKQSILFLKGKINKEEAIESIKKETRHFAKRQISWFKNQIKIDKWIDLDNFDNISLCAKDLANFIRLVNNSKEIKIVR